jgi:hypothetical protein
MSSKGMSSEVATYVLALPSPCNSSMAFQVSSSLTVCNPSSEHSRFQARAVHACKYVPCLLRIDASRQGFHLLALSQAPMVWAAATKVNGSTDNQLNLDQFTPAHLFAQS